MEVLLWRHYLVGISNLKSEIYNLRLCRELSRTIPSLARMKATAQVHRRWNLKVTSEIRFGMRSGAIGTQAPPVDFNRKTEKLYLTGNILGYILGSVIPI